MTLRGYDFYDLMVKNQLLLGLETMNWKLYVYILV